MSPQKKNYGCETSESCSLMSVSGLSSKSTETNVSTPTYSYSTTCNSSSCSSSSTCSSSECSSSSSCLSSSSCSSEVTYSDTTSCSTVSVSVCDEKSKNKCEPLCNKECTKLVKKYNCAREELLAIADIIVILNFIKSKLIAVQPNVVIRDPSKYTVDQNIEWLESFVDTLFCVLRKNEAYKVIKVKECKLKNDCDNHEVSNRTYLIEVKYNTKHGSKCTKIPLTFEWSQITNNTAKSYNGVLNHTINEIDKEIKAYQAQSTLPFLH